MKENQLENGPGDHESSPQQGLPTQTSHLRLVVNWQNLLTVIRIMTNRFRVFLGLQVKEGITPVLLYKMRKKKGTFMDFFHSFNMDLKSITFKSKEQIKKFAIGNQSLARAGCYGTFFLFTEMVNNKEEFFVARVCFNHNGYFTVFVFGLSNDFVWTASNRHRFVVPASGLLIKKIT